MQENSWLSTWTDSSVSTPPSDLHLCSDESNCVSGTGELAGGACVGTGGDVSEAVGDAESAGDEVIPGIEADGDSDCGVGVAYVLAGAVVTPDDTGATVTHWPLLQAFTAETPGNWLQAVRPTRGMRMIAGSSLQYESFKSSPFSRQGYPIDGGAVNAKAC